MDLAGKEYWEALYSSGGRLEVAFNPLRRNFRDLHRLFEKHLPAGGGRKFLELGCCPGRFLWYFSRYFGYEVSGLDYLESGCRRTEESLAEAGVTARVIQADLFSYTPEDGERWDVVASFGLVEHFENGAQVLARHAGLTRPGGYVLVVVPNFQGLYGWILSKVNPRAFRAHRVMSLEELRNEAAGVAGIRVVAAGYHGRLGFGHTGLRELAAGWGRVVSFAVRALLFAVETAGQVLPRTRHLSPWIVLLARREEG